MLLYAYINNNVFECLFVVEMVWSVLLGKVL